MPLKNLYKMNQERTEKLLEVMHHRQPDLTVVLENVFDPHNISAVMRTCDAVGIYEIYVLNSRIPRHKKFGPRSSSSADKWITVHQFEDVDHCFEAVRKKYDHIYTTHLSEDAVSVYELDLTRKTALVFGNEHSGCSEEIIKKADGNFLIPQVGIIQSLNISVACAVTIYEAFRQKKLAGHYDSERLPEMEQAKLFKDWKMYDMIRRS
jgi:tRNA (guanosine-2'-O-)-methyltransferase